MAYSSTTMRLDSVQPSIRAAASTGAATRFETLDSWRGICALIVAMMHFPAAGILAESPVVRGGYLFVDYFFVLSGAVIAHGYGHKIADDASYLRFIVLRLGRVYPLHLAVLALFVAFELLRLAVPALAGDGPQPFTEGNSVWGLLSSLFLLNGVGFADQLVWNGPSWSISSELWTYLFFGAVLVFLRDRMWIALTAAVIVIPVILLRASPTEFMDTTYAHGFLRCVYGFSLGVLVYMLFRRHAAPADNTPSTTRQWTLIEAATVAIVATFVASAADNAWSFAAPFVFGAALLVFMHERGLISRLLRNRPFLWLGSLSYGIYMLHIFVQARMINAASLGEKLTGLDIVGPFELAGQAFYGFGVSGPLLGMAAMLVMIVATVIAAWIGHTLVEKPFQAMTRRVFDGRVARSANATRRYANVASRSPGQRIGAAVPA